MPNIGIPGLVLILIIALIVFGPAKLPQLGKAAGQTLKEFKVRQKASLMRSQKNSRWMMQAVKTQEKNDDKKN